MWGDDRQFSVVYGVLLRPLPYPNPDRIMAIFEVTSKGRPGRVADPNFDDFRDQNHSFQAVAKYNDYVVSVSGASQPTRTAIAQVSPDFLKVFGMQPILGRGFVAADAKKGAASTVLVSYGYWRQELGAAQDLSQAHLKIDGAPSTVIGVLPAGFHFPADVDLWLPADLDGEGTSRTSHNFSAVGRLRDGDHLLANQDIMRCAAFTRHRTARNLLKDGVAMPPRTRSRAARSPLLVLLGAVGSCCWWRAPTSRICCWRRRRHEAELAVRSTLAQARAPDPSVSDRSLPAVLSPAAAWASGRVHGRGGTCGARTGQLPGSTASRSVFLFCLFLPRPRSPPGRRHRHPRDLRGRAAGRGRRGQAGSREPTHRPATQIAITPCL